MKSNNCSSSLYPSAILHSYYPLFPQGLGVNYTTFSTLDIYTPGFHPRNCSLRVVRSPQMFPTYTPFHLFSSSPCKSGTFSEACLSYTVLCQHTTWQWKLHGFLFFTANLTSSLCPYQTNKQCKKSFICAFWTKIQYCCAYKESLSAQRSREKKSRTE